MSRRWFEFGPFRLDPDALLLLRDNEPLRLTPKAVATLSVLVQNSGNLVPKSTLMKEVWPESFVEEGSLTRNVSDLRKALTGTTGAGVRIETVPKRGYRFVGSVREERMSAQPAGRALAVLPFRSLGGHPRDRALGLSIADALITKLATLRGCVVQPTSAVAAYRNARRDPLHIGRRLGVEVVIDGSVRLSGSRARVTTQLLDTASSAPLWAETFEETFDSLWLLEDSVSEQLAGAVALWLGESRRKLVARRYAGNREAYQLYLRGRYQWSVRTERRLRKAIGYFRQALRADPEYGLAYSGLAGSYAFLPMLAPLPARQVMPRARAAAMNALEIDDSLAEARAVLAFVKWHYDWNWLDAEREFRRVLRFAPDDVITHQWYSLLLAEQGRSAEAVAEARRAQRLEPEAGSVCANVATVLFFTGRYDQAIEQALKAVALDPGSARGLLIMGLALERQGKLDQAIASLERASTVSPSYPAVPGAFAHAYALAGKSSSTRLRRLARDISCSYSQAVARVGAGKDDDALAWLEKACDEKNFLVVQLKVDRRLDRLRASPRFAALLRRVGLADHSATG